MRKLLDAIWCFTDSQCCKLWGVSTSSNGLFMKTAGTTVTVGVVKCTGQLMGYVNPALGSPDAVLLNVSVMEDLQRCFLYAQRGWKCCRFNFLAVRTVNRAKGGCSSAFKVTQKECIQDDGGKKSYWCPRAVQESKAMPLEFPMRYDMVSFVDHAIRHDTTLKKQLRLRYDTIRCSALGKALFLFRSTCVVLFRNKALLLAQN